ncbi:MAG: chemotaxis-specific protein-glutamate methyltransferase CheB [Prochlorotrichaceae cyanobacterium]
MSNLIRVLLVEDSPVALTILKRVLQDAPDIQVVGTAINGEEAIRLIPQVKPNLICTDLHMPRMDGLQLTEFVMEHFPCPILVISASVQDEDTDNVFRLLDAGALDIFPKPRTGLATEYEKSKQELLTRIRVLSGVTVFTQRRVGAPVIKTQAKSSAVNAPTVSSPPIALRRDIRQPQVVAIGASTGGPQALHLLFQRLPPQFPVPILCVQHISEGFLQGLVDWLNRECAFKVTIAQSGVVPQPGYIYFPPERHHLLISPTGKLALSLEPPVTGHRPSVTVLFKSVAQYYRRSCVGILLTGMGRDGADGLLSILEAGGITIAQDESTSIVFGMPKEAITLGAAQRVLPIDNIAPFLLNQVFQCPSA